MTVNAKRAQACGFRGRDTCRLKRKAGHVRPAQNCCSMTPAVAAKAMGVAVDAAYQSIYCIRTVFGESAAEYISAQARET